MNTTDKPDHLSFKLQTFSLEQIDKLLDEENFRLLKRGHRDNLASEMRLDRWDSGNGETLAFDDKGKLLNGQHRLSAARIFQQETGRKVWFWCAHGVSAGSAIRCDLGKSRSLTEYLTHEGIQSVNYCATVTLGECINQIADSDSLLAFGRGQLDGSGAKSPKTGKTSWRKTVPLSMAVDVFRRNRSKIEQWAKIGRSAQEVLPRSAVIGALGYQLSKVNQERAFEFIDKLISGEALQSTDPIYLLRKRLQEDRVSKTKLPRVFVVAYIVKAWVAWNKGEEMGLLRWHSSGPRAEEFPDHRDVA